MRIELDMAKLESIAANIPGGAGRVVQKMAQDCEHYIKNDFSPTSPSSPGQPPAVDTGNLKNSVLAEDVSLLTWVVNIGAPYGVHLEYGTNRMAARPFVKPATEKVRNNLPRGLIKKVVE